MFTRNEFTRRRFLQSTVAAALTAPGLLRAETAGHPARLATRPIPASGEALPIMGLGNSQAFKSNDYTTTRELIEIMLRMGGKLVDAIGDSMHVLGKVSRDLNAELFIATAIEAEDKAAGEAFIQAARNAQHKGVLDLLELMHTRNIETSWGNLRAWKDTGLTRYIGVAIANRMWYDSLEPLIKSGTMDFVQLNYSLIEPESGERLIPLAQDHGVAVITNRPFINGEYFKRVSGKPLPSWADEFECQSWAQFGLKWILANPTVNCTITETANPKHAMDNLGAGSGVLPDAQQRERMQAYFHAL